MIRQCQQTKCELRGTGQCPICTECQAPPDNVATDNCINCWSCEHDIGYVRTGIRKDKIDQKIGIMIIEKESEQK
jgi:hypothetical protein